MKNIVFKSKKSIDRCIIEITEERVLTWKYPE